MPYDRVIPLLDAYPDKTVIWKDTCTPLHAHSSAIYKRQDKEAAQTSIYRSRDKEDVIYINSGILLGQKKNEIMSFAATQMDLEIIILSEVSQKETNTTWLIHASKICK